MIMTIKVITLKRRKVRDSHLAGRDLSKVKVVLLPARKKIVKSFPPEKNETFFSFTDATIA